MKASRWVARSCSCLLGVELNEGKFDRLKPLTGQDIEVLAMQVSPSWTAEGVCQFLEQSAAMQPGLQIDYVVTDGGNNLRKALRDRGLDRVSDCTHLLMNLVKKQFQYSDLLSQLCAHIGTLRRQTLMGRYGYLAPPTLRDKDRFLRIFNILDWVAKIDAVWSTLDEEAYDRLAFIEKYRPLLRELEQVRALISLTGRVFKSQGLSPATIQAWKESLQGWMNEQANIFASVEMMIAAVEEYVVDHHRLTQKHGKLLCCSDIIESTFGRYKNKGGIKAISADILKIPLYNVDITPDFVDKAMSTVSYQQVYEWETINTSPTRYGQLKALRERPKSASLAA